MNDWTAPKKTLILIGALILILVILLAINIAPKTPKTEPKFPGDTISAAFKTKIGETTDKEVSSMPDLLNKKETDGKTVYTFKPAPSLTGHEIITEGGKAAFEKGTIKESPAKLPSFPDYTNKYGQPEAEFSGSKVWGKFEKTYVYASLGFALKVNPFTQEVHEIQKFAPISINEYLQKWGEDVTSFVETKEQF